MQTTISLTRRGAVQVLPAEPPGGSQLRQAIRQVKGESIPDMFQEVFSRNALRYLMKYGERQGVCITDEFKETYRKTVKERKDLRAPFYAPSDYELISYLGDQGEVECVDPTQINAAVGRKAFTAGKKYRVSLTPRSYTRYYTRNKPEWDPVTQSMSSVPHSCYRRGGDVAVKVNADQRVCTFVDSNLFRIDASAGLFDFAMLWVAFKRPVVETVKELKPKTYDKNIDLLETHEVLSNFNYYPGQKDYIARLACKSHALAAAETGCGKTLVAISLMLLKQASRVLIMAPKGTVKGVGGEIHYDPAQWEQEIRRFAPNYPVYRLFSRSDFLKLRGPGGELPEGVFITYPDAYLLNGAVEALPESWTQGDYEKKVAKKMGVTRPGRATPWDNIGHSNVHGIQCIAKPSIATEVGDQFDMVLLDESHLMQSMSAKKTAAFLRLRAKYRYALSATPIPNNIRDIFPVMGWLCVPDWFKGHVGNAAWPYVARGDLAFAKRFLSTEVDETATRKNYAQGIKRKVRTTSSTVTNAITLLRILKSSLAFITKKRCNPSLVECNVIDVRVPFGVEQERMYAAYATSQSPLTGQGKYSHLVQHTYLRGVCADPMDVKLNASYSFVRSSMNPKLLTLLNLIRECLERGEQVVVVSSRTGQTSELQRRLHAAGVPTARVDSKTNSNNHSAQSNLFKSGEVPVMLMGIKMAQGFSFAQCPNLIVGSLEWNYASKNQAMGRVFRLNSPKDVRIWCVLNSNSIEEVMFDRVSDKQDVSSLCLKGRPSVNDIEVKHADEILMDHVINYRTQGGLQPESECEKQWSKMANRLKLGYNRYYEVNKK